MLSPVPGRPSGSINGLDSAVAPCETATDSKFPFAANERGCE